MAQIAPEYCTESSSFLNWRDAVCDVVIDLDCSMIGDEPFQGRIDFRALCDTRIIKVSATAHAVERDRCRIGRADDEFVLVSQMVTGRATILQGGREARLRPGEFAIYDSMTPYVIALTEPFTMNAGLLRFVLMRCGGTPPPQPFGRHPFGRHPLSRHPLSRHPMDQPQKSPLPERRMAIG